MAESEIVTHSDLTLRPDPSRTVIRPFSPGDPAAFAVDGHPRAQRIVERVMGMTDADVEAEVRRVIDELDDRHRMVEHMLLHRFDEIRAQIGGSDDVSHDRKLLIGAYFSEEYSFEAAALFNPSMVLHRDQSDLPADTIRFVLSLRGIGEGHVSSVTFRRGTWGPNGPQIETPSVQATPPQIQAGDGDDFDGTIKLCFPDSQDLSETVLFPIVERQSQGIEDMRLVDFVEDDGTVRHLGTYTAFGGGRIQQELMEATDFRNVTMRPLKGAVADAKGMALFPRRIGGRYVALGRQDNENIWLLETDDLYNWTEAKKLLTPAFPWDFVQIGNCGSPMEIDEGWLVLTHGVGMVRNYCIGACLLDKDDPAKVLGRMQQPLLEPGANERNGYVPNVVYSCGGVVHDRTLLLPYGIADYYTAFASAKIDDVLARMK